MNPIKQRCIIVQALISGFLILLFFSFFWFKNHSAPVPATSRQVRFGFTIRNRTNKPATAIKLWAYAPVPEGALQSCEDIQSTLPFQMQRDEIGNRILLFSTDMISPYGSLTIKVTAKTTHYAFPIKGQRKSSDRYLSPEPFIEADHPDIVKLATSLRQKRPMETAQAVFNWVASNIQYSGYIKNRKGALHTFKTASGDCTEYMFLFIALCRANQLPARGIGGYRCSGNCILKPSDYHNWAEVLVDGIWTLADCQEKVFDKNATDYIAMNIISGREEPIMKGYQRFRFQGDGVSVHMNH